MAKRDAFSIGGERVPAGTHSIVNLEMPNLSSQTQISMPVHIVHGKKDGPVLLVSAAIHGDEMNGIEIIRKLLATRGVSQVRGTLVAVPVVNAYGLLQTIRTLPDGRDLNRSFPGSERGSLAARLANLFIEEIFKRCDYAIDLHTGAGHRTNLPQIRTILDNPVQERLARAFGVPVILNAGLREGTLRSTAAELGVPILLYEAGEALRYNDLSIRAGVAGIVNVMRELAMLPPLSRAGRSRQEPFIAHSSRWLRAPESGMLRLRASLGENVAVGQVLAYIDDPAGGEGHPIVASRDGVVIGRLQLPIVHEGDAVYHIASFDDDATDVAEQVDVFSRNYTDTR